METLTVTITDPRIIDAYIHAGNISGMSAESLASEFLHEQGIRYANDFKIGIITSASFMSRFTPEEYSAIISAATNEETAEVVAPLISELTSSAHVTLDDQRLSAGLQLLSDIGLLEQERIAELLKYERPTYS
jgi:predicted metal-dependent phosphotriesterase family hydrolase